MSLILRYHHHQKELQESLLDRPLTITELSHLHKIKWNWSDPVMCEIHTAQLEPHQRSAPGRSGSTLNQNHLEEASAAFSPHGLTLNDRHLYVPLTLRHTGNRPAFCFISNWIINTSVHLHCAFIGVKSGKLDQVKWGRAHLSQAICTQSDSGALLSDKNRRINCQINNILNLSGLRLFICV